MAKTKTNTYTVSELARIADVTPASMSAYIQKLGLKPTKTGKYNRKYFNQADYDKIMEHYHKKPKTEAKTTKTTKDDVINTQQRLIDEQARTIDLLREQLAVKDKQIETANRLADQAQKLDLTTHQQQQKELPKNVSNSEDEKQTETKTSEHHGFFWKLTH